MNEVFIYIFPGMLFMWLFFIAQSPMQEIITEGRQGTLGRILAAPVRIESFLAAKIIRAFMLCMFAQFLMLLVTWLIFSVKWGNPVMLLIICVCGAVAVIGPMAVIYSFARTAEQGNMLSTILILTAAMLGGSMFPYEEMPGFLKAFAHYTPNRWAVIAFQSAAWERPMDEFVKPLLILAGIGSTSMALGFMLFRRRLGEALR
jgi:ABC-2 type transport system permease protein